MRVASHAANLAVAAFRTGPRATIAKRGGRVAWADYCTRPCVSVKTRERESEIEGEAKRAREELLHNECEKKQCNL